MRIQTDSPTSHKTLWLNVLSWLMVKITTASIHPSISLEINVFILLPLVISSQWQQAKKSPPDAPSPAIISRSSFGMPSWFQDQMGWIIPQASSASALVSPPKLDISIKPPNRSIQKNHFAGSFLDTKSCGSSPNSFQISKQPFHLILVACFHNLIPLTATKSSEP